MPLPDLRSPTWDDLRAFVRGLLARRWMRFCIVGGAATLVYYFSGLFFVSLLGLPVLAGNALAYLAGFVVSYLGQCLWTFQAEGSHRAMLPRFAATQGVGLALNSGIIWLLMAAGMSYAVAMWVAIAAVPVAVYFICKLWVFRS